MPVYQKRTASSEPLPKRRRSPSPAPARVTRRRKNDQPTSDDAVSQVLAPPASDPGYLDSKNKKYFPAELRQKIWEYAMPDPVVILIGHDDPKAALHFTRPNLLRVCRESRAVALTRYKRFTGISRGKKPIYIDFERDEIHILTDTIAWCKGSYSYLSAVKSLAKKVQRLIISRRTFDDSFWEPRWHENDTERINPFSMIPRIWFGNRPSSATAEAPSWISFPSVTHITIVTNEKDVVFTKLAMIRTLIGQVPPQYKVMYQAYRSNILFYGSLLLPVPGSNPTTLRRQRLLDWYLESEDWQLEYVRLMLHREKKKALQSFRQVRNLTVPSISILYPGKDVEFVLKDGGDLVNGHQYPDLGINYPSGHEMVEITEADLAECTWLN